MAQRSFGDFGWVGREGGGGRARFLGFGLGGVGGVWVLAKWAERRKLGDLGRVGTVQLMVFVVDFLTGVEDWMEWGCCMKLGDLGWVGTVQPLVFVVVGFSAGEGVWMDGGSMRGVGWVTIEAA